MREESLLKLRVPLLVIFNAFNLGSPQILVIEIGKARVQEFLIDGDPISMTQGCRFKLRLGFDIHIWMRLDDLDKCGVGWMWLYLTVVFLI